ncbi:uncharacterized protein GGS22DRAFT_99835 [Annulohypoxylon maeteangense]|uniref:uncharacterized protein n=1 Tax=Annulohypoxylon maeteangense TaxID=1927788 RepID=UPI00200883EA|nr:uncharacterized protein GGS22DRAFT_99835 [Annulohypoxylon maeteangense]KAI0880102.1 hypothetical protein GGS22DRAFT_99835 [Annulohypoxylon maeteangense]
MSATAKAPKTIEQLQAALRLKDKSSAEALIKANAVTEAFRKYSNRCLSSGSTIKLLPDWKDVDGYVHDMHMSRAVRRAGKTLKQVVEQDCLAKPYELIPHAAMFALRIMTFLKSKDGEIYDVPLKDNARRSFQDLQFDRCVRIMNLLGFLVNQNRERKANRAVKEGNWI